MNESRLCDVFVFRTFSLRRTELLEILDNDLFKVT